jgi:hypothetical protein
VYANQGGYQAQVQHEGRLYSQWSKTVESAAEFATSMRQRLFAIPLIGIAPVAPA